MFGQRGFELRLQRPANILLLGAGRHRIGAGRFDSRVLPEAGKERQRHGGADRDHAAELRITALKSHVEPPVRTDRKSGGKGKRVAERVYLGGCSIIKKKK